jgi:AhpD family alkylhydroperoxidase
MQNSKPALWLSRMKPQPVKRKKSSRVQNGCGYCIAAHSMIADKVAKFKLEQLAAVRAGQILEVILAISVKMLSNYSKHIFHTDLDEAFSAY